MAATTDDLPRVLCDACPAYATVSLVERHPVQDATYVVATCHGETVAAVIYGEALRAARGRGRPLMLRELSVLGPDVLRDRCAEIAESLARGYAYLSFYERLAAGSQPDLPRPALTAAKLHINDDSITHEEATEIAEAWMNRADELRKGAANG